MLYWEGVLLGSLDFKKSPQGTFKAGAELQKQFHSSGNRNEQVSLPAQYFLFSFFFKKNHKKQALSFKIDLIKSCVTAIFWQTTVWASQLQGVSVGCLLEPLPIIGVYPLFQVFMLYLSKFSQFFTSLLNSKKCVGCTVNFRSRVLKVLFLSHQRPTSHLVARIHPGQISGQLQKQPTILTQSYS